MQMQTIQQLALNALLSIEDTDIELHSFCVSHREQICAEVYFNPLTKTSLHRMYSITKSLTALAIGLLEADGKINISDPIVQYFPEYVPANPHPWLLNCTIQHLLSMQSCHTKTTYKADRSKHWVQSFFTAKPDKPPGIIFHYDTSSSHVLACLIEKICEKPLLDYLRSCALDEIGFSKDAYIIQDPFGTSMGGSGLIARTSDLIKLGNLLIQDGKWNGKQLLPQAFIKDAVTIQSTTKAIQGFKAEGYGYQFWVLKDDGYAGFGMGGQFMLCWPKYDLVIATTADTQGMFNGDIQLIDIIFKEIVSQMPRLQTSENECNDTLESLTVNAKFHSLPTIKTSQNFSGVYTLQNNAIFSKLYWEFASGLGKIEFMNGSSNKQIIFGIGQMLSGNFSFSENDEMYAASGGWISDNEILIRISLLGEEPSSIHIRAVFTSTYCTMEFKRTCETAHTLFEGIWNATR